MKIALAQISVVAGDPERNVARMLECAHSLAGSGALLLFPELCVGGYLVGDLWHDADYLRWLEGFHAPLREASGDLKLAIAFGDVFRDPARRNKDGRPRLYNAAYLFDHGALPAGSGFFPPGVQPKTLQPNYRFFDESRYFFTSADAAEEAGVPLHETLSVFTLQNGARVGLQLCEDLWCADYRRAGRSVNTARWLTEAGAQLLANLSASPWSAGKNAARARRIRALQSECERPVPFLYVNRVGAENCGDNLVVYDGGSAVYDAEGHVRQRANGHFEEELLFVEAALEKESAQIVGRRLADAPEEGIAQKQRALRTGLRHLETITGNPQQRFLVGVSGGLDSAVVAALLQDAFGPERVTAVTMPSRYTSAATLGNARQIARELGLRLLTVPIARCVEALDATLEPLGIPENGLACENDQARIRGALILSGLAARLGALYTNNGNKLETALGYATLYGDVNGALAPIGDLLKTEVAALARYLNESVFGRPVVPENLLPGPDWTFGEGGVAPSAELRAGQLDPMKFGYHDALLRALTAFQRMSGEEILSAYLAGELHTRLEIPLSLLQRWGLDAPRRFVEDLEWFLTALRRAVFKRIQAPPIIITSTGAFGYDHREAQLPAPGPTAAFRALREKVLLLERYPGGRH